jgi:hypothetical protein
LTVKEDAWFWRVYVAVLLILLLWEVITLIERATNYLEETELLANQLGVGRSGSIG